jgi:Transcription factor WhiB
MVYGTSKNDMETHAMLGSSGKETDGIKAPGFDGTQLCAQTDPELFFPEKSTSSRIEINAARKLCSVCPFNSPCLEYAIKHSELVGIWAGTTQRQRQQLRANKAA